MKSFPRTFFLLFSLLSERFCSVDAVGGLVDESYSFEDFLAEFGKSYSDQEEYRKRQTIFEKNLRTILSHNKQADLSQGGHVLGGNPFADLEAEELPRGYDKMQSTARLQQITTTLSTERHLQEVPFTVDPVVDLPASRDWRTAGVTTPVKSQGQCGSCWAFASTAVLESHIAIQTGNLFSLSEQELVSCAPNPRNCGGSGGCAGATAEVAFSFAMEKGMVQEWDFGYQSGHEKNVKCALVDEPSLQGVRAAKTSGSSALSRFKGAVASIEGYYQLPTNSYQMLMNAVANHGPVTVSVACSPWHLYHGGVFYSPLNTTRATDLSKLSFVVCCSFQDRDSRFGGSLKVFRRLIVFISFACLLTTDHGVPFLLRPLPLVCRSFGCLGGLRNGRNDR
jgi:cathepsin L